MHQRDILMRLQAYCRPACLTKPQQKKSWYTQKKFSLFVLMPSGKLIKKRLDRSNDR